MSATQPHKQEQKRPIVSGFILLGIGLFLLLLTMDILPPLRYSWPMFIIIAGLALILGAIFKKQKTTGNEFHQDLGRQRGNSE